jgi:hypothetical protein
LKSYKNISFHKAQKQLQNQRQATAIESATTNRTIQQACQRLLIDFPNTEAYKKLQARLINPNLHKNLQDTKQFAAHPITLILN